MMTKEEIKEVIIDMIRSAYVVGELDNLNNYEINTGRDEKHNWENRKKDYSKHIDLLLKEIET